MTALAAIVIAALTWFPEADWQRGPDPIADPCARKGGTLRFNGAQAPKSANGYVDNSSYTRMVFNLMYETLLTVDSVTLDFRPSLARRWAVSDDGREFVFELDSAARWSDGVSVTSADVKWTFDTVMATGSDTGAWKVMLGVFESPDILDERTVRFRKKGSSPKDWRDLIHCALFNIMPKHAFEGKNFNSLDFLGAPVGGPYCISRVAEQVETEYSRVRNWWRRDFPDCKSVYNFDTLVMRYYVDNENAFEALKKRAIDVYPVYTARIMAEETHGEKFDRNWLLARSVHNHKPVGFQGFAMNMRRKPFDDLRVRKAMSMLIDRETMNRTMMHNAYFLQKSFFTDIYDADHPCTNTLYRYDIEAARKLLAEAGLENGFSFVFLSRSGTEDKFLALFNHALTQCNVKMEIVRRDFASWSREVDAFNYDMTWAAWGADVFRNPETMWRSGEADRKGSNNITGFKSAEVDRLIDIEKQATAMSERMELYRRIDALIAAECPYAFLWNTDSTRLMYWNKFGMPETVLDKFGDEEATLAYWWYDDDKARELGEAMRHHTCLPTLPRDVTFAPVAGASSPRALWAGRPRPAPPVAGASSPRALWAGRPRPASPVAGASSPRKQKGTK